MEAPQAPSFYAKFKSQIDEGPIPGEGAPSWIDEGRSR